MTYIDALRVGYPGVLCHMVGELDTYESIVWEGGSPLPSKAALDGWIEANTNAVQSARRVTVLAFRNRFTIQEKIGTEMASVDNPAASPEVRQFAATIRVILRDTDSASFVDLDRTDTRQGVMLLEQYGIIAPGRGIIILDTPITELEKPLTTEFER